MTKFILPKKVLRNKTLSFVYKTSIIFYSLYLTFSAQAFTLEAEAPVGGKSFKQVLFDDTANLERKVRQDTLQLRQERISKIESYYARYDLPLQHEAEHFVNAAEKYDIDWRLVAAIGFIESTGGKFACSTADYSAFGWGSCGINFDSYAESIDVVSWNLGGHNPNTGYAYKDKDLTGVLYSYNSVIPDYKQKILKEMEKISSM